MNRAVSRPTWVLVGGLVSCVLWTAGVVSAEPGAQKRSPPLPRWRDNSGMVFVRGGELTYRGRQVRVRSFYIDQCEVTNGQYCRFLNDGNAKHWNPDQEIENQGVRRTGSIPAADGELEVTRP